MKTQSFAALASNLPLEPYTLTRRELGPHDILIDIKFCGICHSDIHQARNEWGASNYPMVPGHEIVGIVSQIGPSVKQFKIGDRAGVGCMVDSCGHCSDCEESEEQFCDKKVFTYNAFEKDGKTLTQGGYAQHIVVDERFVLHIPEALPLDKAAPLLCAGITTYSPLKHWGVKRGDRVAIMGLGGLGHVAVKIAVAMGADVTVLSHSEKKREDALALGAKHFFALKTPEDFQQIPVGFDFILNTISAAIDLNPYLALLRRDGTMVMVGLPDRPNEVHAFSLVMGRRSLAGSPIGGIKETQETLDFCAKHNITADIEVIPAAQVNVAFERVIKGDVKYRFVLDMQQLS
jgi:alcohol dehydrogenase (NADP+)